MFWKTACALFLLFCHLLVFLQRWIRVISDNQMVFLRQFPPQKEKILEIFLLALEPLRPFRNFVSKEKKILIERWPGGFVFMLGGWWWIIEKAREFQKNIYFCFIDYAQAFDCVDHNRLEKFFKRWEYQTTWPAPWETYMQVRKQQLELDTEQQTCSK